MTLFRPVIPFLALALAACGTQPIAKTSGHIRAEVAPPPATIPPTVKTVPLPPPPKPQARTERLNVVVFNTPVQEVLFALARDARVNVDVHPGIEGRVTLNAIDQTLPQVLTRLSKQVDMRFEMDGPNLVVMPDAPFLRSYKVDYVNIARTSTGTVGISTQVATTGSSNVSPTGGSASGGASNSSTTTVGNASNNRFWETLVANVKDILRETDKVFPEGSVETQALQTGEARRAASSPTTRSGAKSSAGKEAITSPASELAQQTAQTVEQRFTFREAASVIANPETGVISVRATGRQHEKVQEFLDRVMGSARRQVLIEATIVEVVLSDQYQAGVDWSRVASGGNGFSFTQQLTPGVTNSSSGSVPFLLSYVNPNARIGGNVRLAVELLSTFGTTRVLSSPRIMALNNQTALLKVVDERVFFTTDVKITDGNQNTPSRTDFTTTLHTVPIGLVMSVTPQVGDNDEVSLNVRPTISRIRDFVTDPTPRLLGRPDVVNRVPEIQVRELESILRIPSGQTVVLGGLMQDTQETQRDGLPVLSRMPVIGDAFSFRNDTSGKSELVIFLRPLVIRDASLAGDFSAYRDRVPDERFFAPVEPAKPGS